jgi:hypothetical protein
MEPKLICINPCMHEDGHIIITTGEQVEVVHMNDQHEVIVKKLDGTVFGYTSPRRFLLVDHPIYDTMLTDRRCHYAS